jgi:hypothetical protein
MTPVHAARAASAASAAAAPMVSLHVPAHNEPTW